MDFGHFSDKGIPANNNAEGIKVNSLGYRCPEFNVPAGKKKVDAFITSCLSYASSQSENSAPFVKVSWLA